MVDDDIEWRDGFEFVFERSFEGHECMTARSVDDALGSLTESRFDAVVTDYNLPNGQTGARLYGQARNRYAEGIIEELPTFVSMSSGLDRRIVDRLLESGFKAHWDKSKICDLDRLEEELRECIGCFA